MKHKELADISKASFMIAEKAKNAVAHNITTAVARKDLKIDRDVLPRLLALLNASVDQGFQETSKEFERVVNLTLDSVYLNAQNETKKA